MPTVLEIISKIDKLKHEQAILNQLLEYLDNTFLGAISDAKMILLTDDRKQVPNESIELFASKLSGMQEKIEFAIKELLELSTGITEPPNKGK